MNCDKSYPEIIGELYDIGYFRAVISAPTHQFFKPGIFTFLYYIERYEH